jgi:protein-L-isoaspartate(D-aspartate) O-methyltransferase
MAWQCSATSYAGLINNMHSAKLIQSLRVRDAMLQVDRRNYFGTSAHSISAEVAYQDAPQHIGEGQTISAPHMHAQALDLLESVIPAGGRVLDLGSGSGYLTACFAALVGPTGRVWGIERHGSLAAASLRNVKADGKEDWLTSGRLSLTHGDGSSGLAAHAPFNAIHVGPC